MVRNTENYDIRERRGFGVRQALGVLEKVFGDWAHIVWKAAVLYAVWIGLAHTLMTNAASSEGMQLAAIGYWFGWLFLGMTVAVGLFIGVSNWLDKRQLTRHQSEY